MNEKGETMTEKAVRKAARILAKRSAGKGGKARFAKLSQEERREVARHAAAGRWGKKRVQDVETVEEDTGEA
jgi:hypothetical protein